MTTVAAVLLSAGESTRMGKTKALLDWGAGQSLLRYQIATLMKAGYSPVVVVLGHNPETLANQIPDHPDVKSIINQDYQSGRASSVAQGVSSLPKDIDGVLVISIDQPRSITMLEQLKQEWESTKPRPPIAVPTYGGRVGHPTLFNGSLVPMLLNLSEKSEGMRSLMVDFRERRLLVPTDDPLTLTNMNTPEDYSKTLNIATNSRMYQLK